MAAALLLRGEALFEIVVEDGGLTLLEAVAWDVTGGRGDWMYRADFSVPSGSISRVIPADRVLNPRIGATPARSWRGQSPLPTLTTTLAGILESKLIEEIKGPQGSVVPVPHTGNLGGLQADIAGLKGRTVLVESTSGGYGDAAAAPKADWMARRIGANPPTSLMQLRGGTCRRLSWRRRESRSPS